MTNDQKLILVVDDEPVNLQMVHSVLRDEYRTRVASSPLRVLDLAMKEPRPDLILLDVVMPGLDGYEVCAQLKAEPLTRDIPVLFLTGQTDVAAEMRGFEAGAVDYIHKPFSPPVIKARVRTHLALRETVAQLSREKARSDQLLASLLPESALQEIHATGSVRPRRFENVAVLFCDLVGFTKHCDGHGPEEVVRDLSAMFLEFDRCASRHGLEKIKTIGDAFLAAAGLLEESADPLWSAVECARELCGAAAAGQAPWQIRAGVHIGPLVAGIVGQERYQYDIWGDTVNVAARLTSAASPGMVAMLEEVGRSYGEGLTVAREVELKGKGRVRIVEVPMA